MPNDKEDNRNPQPPQSLDAEQAVLGSILKDSEALDVAMAAVKCDDFYYPKHREIFRACTDLSAKSEPCDITTVANHLLNKGVLERIGGRLYLVRLAEYVASTANLESHAKIVSDKSDRRRLIGTCNEIVRSAYGDTETDELLAQAEGGIIDISKRKDKQKITSLQETLPATMELAEELQRGEVQKSWIYTGFTDLDGLAGAVRPKMLTYIAGRPSHGKTTMAVQASDYISSRGGAVGVFSLEMSQQQLDFVFLCTRARVDYTKLEEGKFTHAEMDKLTHAANIIRSGAGIYISDTPALTPHKLLVAARRLVEREGVKMIIVDYVQLMDADGGKHDNRNAEMTYISRKLKMIAKELNIPVVGLSQLSRPQSRNDNARPTLAMLRDSGALEQDADRVIFPWRESKELSWFVIGKNRMGKTGQVPMNFTGGRWKDPSNREEQ